MGDTESLSGSKRNGGTSDVVDVRELKLEDLAAVFALGEELFTAERWPNLYRTWDEYEVTRAFDSDGETSIVAEMNGRIVGFALGTLIAKRNSAWSYGYLTWLAVHPDLENMGLGRRLVRRLRERFIELGARMMMVDTDAENERAIAFFKGQGFGNDQEHVYLTQNLTHLAGYHRIRNGREERD